MIGKYEKIINSNKWKDGAGKRNFKAFFENFVDGFMKISVEYFENTKGDLLYTYREKQLNTAIVPILYELSNVFLCEHPIRRRSEESDNNGWVDYWVKYGSTDFNIELKHGYHGLKNQDSIRKITVGEWETAEDQLKKISNQNHTMNDNVLNIALMVIVTYTSQKKYESNMSDCEDIGEIIVKEFELKDFILANIIPNKKMSSKRYERSNGDEYYPYIHILAENI